LKITFVDTETDALTGYSKGHVAVCMDQDNVVSVFRDWHTNPEPFVEHLKGNDLIVGHYFIGFDHEAIKTMAHYEIPKHRVLDTFIVSAVLDYERAGGHSLEAWGERFGDAKSSFSDFSKWSQALEDRCIKDVQLTKKIYERFEKYINSPRWSPVFKLEMESFFRCNELNRNGFPFNAPEARKILEELQSKVSAIEETFVDIPGTLKLERQFTPKRNKNGSLGQAQFKFVKNGDLTWVRDEDIVSLYSLKPFNPRSSKDRVSFLNDAGWKPFDKTKGHQDAVRRRKEFSNTPEGREKLNHFAVYGWKCSEENLETLPDTAPQAAKSFVEYLLLTSRLEDVQEWLNLYNEKTGRIHGTFRPIGGWTQRKAHTAPNMANIPALRNRKGGVQPYGAEFRSLWTAGSPEAFLVGTDAAAVQLRVFAHLVNSKRMIEAIEKGEKKDGTDPHSLNKAILGSICNSRETAKTYIYALLLNAGFPKQAEILQCSVKEAKEGLGRILEYYPEWAHFKKHTAPEAAKKGYIEGLDGRLLKVPDEHRVLAGYLQNGESVIMKTACEIWHAELERLGIHFEFVNDVHDEFQTLCYSESAAKEIMRVQCEAIKQAGLLLNMRIGLEGEAKYGLNWKDTH
jgi:DNA polymerase I-like protein with 3'-5' exonuclease and polymerase domains